MAKIKASKHPVAKDRPVQRLRFWKLKGFTRSWVSTMDGSSHADSFCSGH